MKKCLFLIFIFAATVRAEDKTFTWNDCLRLAAQNNPDLISAQKNYLSSRAQYKGSFNGFMPQINLSNTYIDTDLSDSQSNRWQAAASASMDLINLRSYAAIKSARASSEQAQAGLELASANVRFGVRQAFANLLFAQEKIKVEEQILKFRVDNANMVTLTYDSGRESKGNMLRAKADLRQAQADLASAKRDERATSQELNHQLGLDLFDPIIATGTLAASSLPVLPNTTPLVDRHPQVLETEAAKAVSLASLRAAESDVWPYLLANYTRTLIGQEEFPSTPHWSASGVLSYKIFGNGITSTYYAVSAAKRNLEKSESDLRSVRNNVRSKLEGSWAGFADSLDQLEVQKQYLESSTQRNNEAQVKYTSGLMSFEDWEISANELVSFQKGVIQAQHDSVVAEAAWDQATAKSLEDK